MLRCDELASSHDWNHPPHPCFAPSTNDYWKNQLSENEYEMDRGKELLMHIKRKPQVFLCLFEAWRIHSICVLHRNMLQVCLLKNKLDFPLILVNTGWKPNSGHKRHQTWLTFSDPSSKYYLKGGTLWSL